MSLPVPPKSPFGGLPASPRALRLDTNLTPKPYSDTPSTTSEKNTSPQVFIDTRTRRKDSLIFVNATIPLSPASEASSSNSPTLPYDGLVPRKRNAIARLFSCFGREEKARRRAYRDMEFEKIGDSVHWSEY